MPVRSAAWPVVLVAATLLLGGCGSVGGTSAASSAASISGATSGSAATSSLPASAQATLQLRLVESSTDGPCSEPPLASSAPGSACGVSGTTTYQVGASLGEVTPTAVTAWTGAGDAAGRVFDMEFDDSGKAKLADVTRGAEGNDLAILVAGQVLSAAHVMAPITGGRFRLATTTPDEAATVAA